MYLGMTLACLGVELFFASVPAAAFTLVAVIIGDRFVIPRE